MTKGIANTNTHSALQVQNILKKEKKIQKNKGNIILIYNPAYTYLCGCIKEDISWNPTQPAY